MCAAVLTHTLSCSSRLSPSDTLPRRRSSSSFLLTLCLSSHHRQTLHKHFTFLGSRGCFPPHAPFPFSPRGYCLPLSAILSAACDQTGEPQCASEGPAEGGGSQTPFNHVMPRFCQLVGCQTKILAVNEVAARAYGPLRLPRTHRLSSS